MNHPAELPLFQYLENAANGKSHMSEETIQRIGKDVMDAVRKQFGAGNKRKEFTLRMSNIGRAPCQLWFDKNKPEAAAPKPVTFVMNMMIGDIVEAVFKGVLTEAGISFKDSSTVSLDLGVATVNGTYDLVVDDAVDDVKSASDWSYRNKFESYEVLEKEDPFGYVGQLAGYAKASGYKAGGWWVINKANGSIKYVSASSMNVDEQVDKLKEVAAKVKENVFERCYDAVEETYRGKPTGNKILCTACSFCDYREACWPTLQEIPSKVSTAREPKIVPYVELKE